MFFKDCLAWGRRVPFCSLAEFILALDVGN